MKQNNKAHILFRYGIITILFLLFSAAVVVKMFDTTVIEANDWNRRAHAEMQRVDTIAPERGNILASNGNILACNLRVLDIFVDLRHAKVQQLTSIPWKEVDALADSLDRYYPRGAAGETAAVHSGTPSGGKRPAAGSSWRKRLYEALEKPAGKRPRALCLAKKRSADDLERIKSWPFFSRFKGKGSRNPVYGTPRDVRMYPYGRMAYRSIGRVNENFATGEFHGYSGLEKDLDSLLYGKPGKAKRVALTNGIGSWVTEPPQRGYDIVTTIDIDLQDMLEEELFNVCLDAKAEWGTAILMEVATGEIVAISNIERLDDGTYGEALNRAVIAYEPGSVMKAISMMIAFEDGLVRDIGERVDCSPFQRTNDPHAPTVKTIAQVIEMSSNTGTARVIFRGYAADPAKWHDRLASIGFFDRIGSGIAGEEKPRVRRLLPADSRGNNITMTARHLDLARQAYGYNTVIPPLYTLAYYNAIANGGRLVRPHLVRALRDEEGRDSVLPVSYIREQVCSPQTAAKLRQCLRQVVWGEHGTGRRVRDDRVAVAGKTGTVYPVENGVYNKSKRRYAFAGFFPCDNPRYSCMALVLGPSGASAGGTSGQVVKNMALKMYSRGMLDNKSNYATERSSTAPVFAASDKAQNTPVTKAINVTGARMLHTAARAPRGHVPDMRGYDAPTAVRVLERMGLDVSLAGRGHVVAQHPAPGTPCRRGDRVRLTLKV